MMVTKTRVAMEIKEVVVSTVPFLFDILGPE
jgi:hypothetical protein